VREAGDDHPAQPAGLRAEVLAMREKVRAARPVKDGRFDVKHSPGGMMDAEFAVQYLQLMHSAAPPRAAGQRRQHRPAAARRGGRPAACRRGPAAADAYRELRRAQHRLRLDEQPTQVEPDGHAGPRARRHPGAVAGRLRLSQRLAALPAWVHWAGLCAA
jgi:glutamate-ammonia-ligase adenylyltransferase